MQIILLLTAFRLGNSRIGGDNQLMPDGQRLEEQLLAQEAGRRLSEELDEVENVDINLQTDLLKIIQGQADAVYMTGQGLVIKGIRVQDIRLRTDNIAVNPFSALFGQIELNEPVNVITRLVLTEADLNHALASDLVHGNMLKFDLNLNVDGKIVSLKAEEIQLSLPETNKMIFTGKVLLQETGKTRPLSFHAKLRPQTTQQPIILESFDCTQGDGISLEVVTALLQKAKELLSLPYFDFEDMMLRVKNLVVEKGKLILLVEGHVKQIPSQ